MSRGRKPNSSIIGSDWESVFYNSVGTYVQCINLELSKEYKLEPLSSHLRIIGGYAFKTPEYRRSGIPIIRISDFNNERIILDEVVFYKEAKELEKYELVEGDIIIALTGGTIAKLAIVQPNLGKIYLNQRVGKFQVLNPHEFEAEYIYWIARSVQSTIKDLAWGAAIPNVSPKQIEELEFPFPPKKIQKGIIGFLNDLKNNRIDVGITYFNKIIENEIVSVHEKQINISSTSTELNHQLTLVKKLRQQLLQEAVQGKLVKQVKKDEPASELLKKIKAEKTKLIQEKKIKADRELPPIKEEEIPFAIPDNWVWCRLGEIITFGPSNGYSPIESKKGTGIKCLTLTATTSGIFKEEYFKLVDVEIPIGSSLWLMNNDILLQRGNSIDYVGIAAIYNGEASKFIYPDLMIKIRVPEFIDANFIHKVLISPFNRKYFAANAFGAQKSMPKINQGVVLNTLIPLPPLAEQQRIVAKLGELMQTCNELETSIKQSVTYNERLLQQVLREALQPK